MKKYLFLFLTMTFILFFFSSAAFCSDGMVVQIEQGDLIVINRGSSDQVNTDETFYISRFAEPIAIVKVMSVDSYSSKCQIVELAEGKKIEIGDYASSIPYQKPTETTTAMPTPAEKPIVQNTPSKTEERQVKNSLKEHDKQEKEVNDQFKNSIKKKVQVLQFKKGAKGVIKLNTFDMYNLFSTVLFAGQYASFNAWQGASTAYGIYSGYKATANPNNTRNVQMEITYWDSEYLSSFSNFYAYKESVTDPKKINDIKENINRQKGIDKFFVFQIKIANPGPTAIQIAPFSWHMYLKGRDGQKIKADDYDEILDKALNPNQVVNGYIYFRRFDDAGQRVINSENPTLMLVDILENNREVTFK